MHEQPTAEHRRLSDSAARRADWKNWGPYLAERAWGTVREDYSAQWRRLESFPARPRPQPCLSLERGRPGRFLQPFSERLPVARALERARSRISRSVSSAWPTRKATMAKTSRNITTTSTACRATRSCGCSTSTRRSNTPINLLYEENRLRDRADREFELIDALGDAFAAGRYFDVFVDYAKASEDDILCRITAYNRGPEPGPAAHPAAALVSQHLVVGPPSRTAPCSRPSNRPSCEADHRHLGERWWYLDIDPHTPALLFTENETNFERLFGVPNAGPFVKDAFHEAIVGGRADKVNPGRRGTKAAAHYQAMIEPGGCLAVRTRFSRWRSRPTRLATSTRSSSGGSPRPTSSTGPSSRRGWTKTSAGFSARRMPGCSGPSSSITTAWSSGSTATRPARSRRPRAGEGATRSGSTSTTSTS